MSKKTPADAGIFLVKHSYSHGGRWGKSLSFFTSGPSPSSAWISANSEQPKLVE